MSIQEIKANRFGGCIVRGIYFINEQIELNGLTKAESFKLQEQSLLNFIGSKDIEPIKLNPYQLNPHYTILHALLYDLKAADIQLDCFCFYSNATLDDFITTYPARWLMIQSYFDRILPVSSHEQPWRQVI